MKYLTIISLTIATLFLSGCSVFGKSDVEIAPYKVLQKQDSFELRHYESMVLVTTAMDDLDEDNSPFYKLFNYISGNNKIEQNIPMTAPVFMDQDDGKTETMSFVLPADMSMEEAPLPIDPAVTLEEVTNYTVATVTFNGRLNQDNINQQKQLLETWINDNQFEIIGSPKAAGYNPPFTIPALRRNEILIPVKVE